MILLIKILKYILLFAVAFGLVSLWNFYRVIRPPRIFSSLKPSDLNLSVEEVTIETKDNLKLSAWFIPQSAEKEKEGRRAVIILHGYPADKADMLSIVPAFYPDLAVLLPDMRYFGKSEGSHTTLGLREKEDMKKALDFLESRRYDNVGIFGFSLGGSVGILAAGGDNRIKAAASYAAFSDLKKLGEEVFSSLWILKKPMVDLMLLWSKIFFGESLTKYSPLGIAKELKIPIMIIHGENDEQISFSHASDFKNALVDNSRAEFYFFGGRRHGDLPPEFGEKVKVFFAKSLK